jgi:hypothetical protein
MDENRKRVIGIMAAILASLHMQTADDLSELRRKPTDGQADCGLNPMGRADNEEN